MVTQLAGAYSNFRPKENPDQARTYIEAIHRMVGEFGSGRTAAGIQRSIDYIPDFVPTIAKIRELIPIPASQMQTCTLCHPTGFIRAFEGRTISGNPIDQDLGAVRKCPHVEGKGPVVDDRPGERQYGTGDVKALWRMHKAKRAQLGRPMTLAEQTQLLDELDKKIDGIERKSPRTERPNANQSTA